MLTIFNRVELTLVLERNRQAAICEALSSAGIKYSIKVWDPNPRVSSHRGRMGFAGGIATPGCKIYVNRKDFDLARRILSKLSL